MYIIKNQVIFNNKNNNKNKQILKIKTQQITNLLLNQKKILF
jgi:hypothetical protein